MRSRVKVVGSLIKGLLVYVVTILVVGATPLIAESIGLGMSEKMISMIGVLVVGAGAGLVAMSVYIFLKVSLTQEQGQEQEQEQKQTQNIYMVVQAVFHQKGSTEREAL